MPWSVGVFAIVMACLAFGFGVHEVWTNGERDAYWRARMETMQRSWEDRYQLAQSQNATNQAELVKKFDIKERETRMLEYYINEVDGKLIHAGLIEPRERWGPEKRKQYEEKKP
jgi:hypothetical protein